MDLTVIIPFKKVSQNLCESVLTSILELEDLGPFENIYHDFILDEHITHQYNPTRNIGIKRCETEWIFFMNVHQMMTPNACIHIDTSVAATFSSHGDELLPMGFFCKTSEAQKHLFHVSLLVFAKLLPSFKKSDIPLIREN